MICPLCESSDVHVAATYIACVACGCTTAALYTPDGDEPNLPELLKELWVRRVMAFHTPLGERPTYSWSKSGKWSAKISLAPDAFVYLDSPSEAIDFFVAGMLIEQSIEPSRQEHIQRLYEAEKKKDPDMAAENYLERMNRNLAWAKVVEEMSNL